VNAPAIGFLFIITGTTRGLGQALYQEACSQADSFVVTLSRAASSFDGNHQNIRIDLSDTAAIGPAVSRIRIDPRQTRGDLITILINNAGILDPIGPIGDCDDYELKEAIQVNLIAPMVLARHFFRFGRRLPGRKWLVNITSGAARVPYSGWAAYGASKAGLDMATAVMALDFSRTDPSFAAVAVAPGTVDTAMQAKIRQSTPDQFAMVDKFLHLKASGGLEKPDRTATRLIRYLLQGRFENGGRYDLRAMDA
jgi:benzil reductase ((S)-benzoin forming)